MPKTNAELLWNYSRGHREYLRKPGTLKPCKVCGKRFHPFKSTDAYCSPLCSYCADKTKEWENGTTVFNYDRARELLKSELVIKHAADKFLYGKVI